MPGQFDRETLNAIEAVAETFGMETLARLISSIDREGLVNTRGLIMSMGMDTRTDLAKVAASISFAFEEYGRYQDMRTLEYAAQPPVDKILDWVERKGLSAFGPDPHPYKTKPKPDQRRMNEIAWGIAKNLEAGGRQRRKQRKWFNSTFYANINALQEEIILATGDVAIEEMKASLLDRLQRGATTNFF